MSNDSGLAEPMRVLIQEFQRTVGLVATTKQPSNVLLGTALDELGITAHGHLKRNDPLAKGRQPLKCCREVADECSLPRLLRQGGDLGDGSRGGVRVPDLSYDILRRRDEVGSGRYTAFGQGGHVCIGGRG